MTETQSKLLVDALKQLEGVKKIIREILDIKTLAKEE